jgi:phage terminase large subunit GpA-like protein
MAQRKTSSAIFAPPPPLAKDPEVLRNWRQPRRLSVSEWADNHRVLEPLFASEPGPWRTDRAPYAREVMDSACLPWVRRITFMASTQVGKSEVLNNVAGFYIHQKPSPTMFVLPNRDTARLAGERRVLPMVQASDALMDELTDRAHDVKNREIVFKRSVVYMRSAQSPMDLASVPVRLLLMDEVDKWPQWSGREASPHDLAMERTRTFHDHVAIEASTPTTRDGVIFKEFEEGDRRRFHVPCPHCKTHQILVWSQIRWENTRISTGNAMRKAREAWYECAACSARIDDVHKRQMLREGCWVPDGVTYKDWVGGLREKDRTEHRSYHIWAAYSPWVTFWKIAAQFLDSKDEPAKLMNFTNSWLAEVWEERVESTSEEAVAACIEERPSFVVPPEAKLITVAVDVQVDYLVWQVAAWGYDEESWIVAMGETSDFSSLEAEIMRPWGDQQMMPRLVVVDSRYRRDEVMEFCRRNPAARMIAGVERANPIPFSTIAIDKHPRTGARLKQSQMVWTVNVAMFKDLVAHRLRLSLADDVERPIGRIHLPNDLPEDVLEQMSSEHKVAQRSGSRVKRIWLLKPGRKRNETWDVTVYNAAAAKMIRADTMRSEPPPDYLARRQEQQGRGKRPRVMGRGRGGGVNLPRGGRW